MSFLSPRGALGLGSDAQLRSLASLGMTVLAWFPNGIEVTSADPSRKQRRGDESTVAASQGELLEIGPIAHSPSYQQLEIAEAAPNRRGELMVRAGRAPDPRQVEHQHGTHAVTDCATNEVESRLVMQIGDHRQGLTVSEIEAEDRAGGASGPDDRRQYLERRQCLEANNHPSYAAVEELARIGAALHPRVDEQSQAKRRKCCERSPLHGTPLNGVEIGDIDFGYAEPVSIGAGECKWVAVDPNERSGNRLIAGARPSARVDGMAARQIDDTHYTHSHTR